jgi:hypothetical protein
MPAVAVPEIAFSAVVAVPVAKRTGPDTGAERVEAIAVVTAPAVSVAERVEVVRAPQNLTKQRGALEPVEQSQYCTRGGDRVPAWLGAAAAAAAAAYSSAGGRQLCRGAACRCCRQVPPTVYDVSDQQETGLQFLRLSEPSDFSNRSKSK